MPKAISKPKPKPKPPAPPVPSFHRLQLNCPELISWDAKRSGSEPWVWFPARTALPAAAAIRFEPFESPSQQMVDGATGRRLLTTTTVVSVKGYGKVAVCGAGVGGKTIQLVTAVAMLDAHILADCYAGTFGNPLSDDWFHPATHGRLLARRVELAMLGIVALACRSGECDGMTAAPLCEQYADGWQWADEMPVGPVGSKARLDDPRTWLL